MEVNSTDGGQGAVSRNLTVSKPMPSSTAQVELKRQHSAHTEWLDAAMFRRFHLAQADRRNFTQKTTRWL